MKFPRKLNKEKKLQYCAYIRQGDTQESAAQKVGVSSPNTIRNEIQRDPDFGLAIEQAIADCNATKVNELTHSLFKRCIGFDYEETKIRYKYDSDGKPYTASKEVVTKYYPPDTTALIFALKNLDPEHWEDKVKNQIEAVAQKEQEESQYRIDDIPEDMLIRIADTLQDAAAKRMLESKDEVQTSAATSTELIEVIKDENEEVQ